MKKSNLIFIIVLILLIILSCILGSIQIVKKMKEGMEDKHEDKDAPPCYSTIHDDYAPFTPDEDDKYILKTKIVPPKGTSCPTEISHKDLSPSASNYLNEKSDKDINVTAMSSSNTSNSSTTNSSNTIINTTNATSPSNDKSNVPSPSTSPSSITNDSQYGSVLNDIKGSISQINQQQPKSEQCPPCPACERCPEPSFECKKVPNYRSPSVNQYLPMPILTDFSNF
jgi:hypothetical protein